MPSGPRPGLAAARRACGDRGSFQGVRRYSPHRGPVCIPPESAGSS